MTTVLLVRSGVPSPPSAACFLAISQASSPGRNSSCQRNEIICTRRSTSLEHMGLRLDIPSWIRVWCKNTFGWLRKPSRTKHGFSKSLLLKRTLRRMYSEPFFLQEVKNREYKAPLTDAFETWGYPFEKRKKTGFAARANLVSDDSSILWRYNSLPPAPCGPYYAPSTVSICSGDKVLSCEVKCADDQPPRVDTLRCGHRGAWIGQMDCQSSQSTRLATPLPLTLWPKDGPQAPLVVQRS